MTTGNHMTIGEYIELLLSGEIDIQKLKKFGNKLDEFSQEYAMTRADLGYVKHVQEDMNELIGYLRNGLPSIYERITKRGKAPREFLERFIEENLSTETVAFVITYATKEEIIQSLESA